MATSTKSLNKDYLNGKFVVQKRRIDFYYRLSLAIMVFAILTSFFYYVDRIVMPRAYKFSSGKLQAISHNCIKEFGSDTDSLFHCVAKDLGQEYDGLVQRYDPKEWVINKSGGATGFMFILHASLFEYVIFFGSPLGTEGYTGVHLATDYFTILHGEQWSSFPGDLTPHVFKAGQTNVMHRGQGGHYIFPRDQGCWAVELAQGWIPTMLPFGTLETFTSTLDFVNLWWTVFYTTRAMLSSLSKGKF